MATPAVRRRSLWQHGIAAAVVASVATTIIAALTSAAGVSFADTTGARIPIAGFAQLTLVFSLFGVGLAATLITPHTVAEAIVISTLAGPLARTR